MHKVSGCTARQFPAEHGLPVERGTPLTSNVQKDPNLMAHHRLRDDPRHHITEACGTLLDCLHNGYDVLLNRIQSAMTSKLTNLYDVQHCNDSDILGCVCSSGMHMVL